MNRKFINIEDKVFSGAVLLVNLGKIERHSAENMVKGLSNSKICLPINANASQVFGRPALIMFWAIRT